MLRAAELTFSKRDENVNVKNARLSILNELDRSDFAPHPERQLQSRLLLGERDLGAEAVVEQAPADRAVLRKPRAASGRSLEHLVDGDGAQRAALADASGGREPRHGRRQVALVCRRRPIQLRRHAAPDLAQLVGATSPLVVDGRDPLQQHAAEGDRRRRRHAGQGDRRSPRLRVFAAPVADHPTVVPSTAMPAAGVADHSTAAGASPGGGRVAAALVSAGDGGGRDGHGDVVVAAAAAGHGAARLWVESSSLTESQRGLEELHGVAHVRLGARSTVTTHVHVAFTQRQHVDDVPSSPAHRRTLQVAVFLQIILFTRRNNSTTE